MMPEQREQDDDRQRHTQQPKQRSSSKAHDVLLSMSWTDAAGGIRFRGEAKICSTCSEFLQHFAGTNLCERA
jgi:hypothetical protein